MDDFDTLVASVLALKQGDQTLMLNREHDGEWSAHIGLGDSYLHLGEQPGEQYSTGQTWREALVNLRLALIAENLRAAE